MIDWARHENELASGRSAQIADDVMASARRRHRRWVATGAACVAMLALAIALPVAFGAGTPAAVSGSGAARPPAGGPSDRAKIYAVVIAGRSTGPIRGRPVNVLDHVCAGVPDEPTTDCTGAPIPVSVQREVVAVLGRRVHFVADARWPTDRDQPRVVGFGELIVDGDRATVGAESMCGPLCGTGETLQLTKRAGTWAVTGSIGHWIS